MYGLMDRRYADDRRSKPHLIFRYRARMRVLADAIRKYIPLIDGPRVLDLGCAEGRSLVCLHEMLPGCKVIGVELSRDLIDSAPSLPPGVEIIQGDICNLPASLAAGTFDAVSALAVLEHLPEPGLAVAEAARLLKPGGIFVATCPHPFWERISKALRLLVEEHHESKLGREALERCVRASGMEAIEYRRFMWAPLGIVPYTGIGISTEAAARVDRLAGKIPLANGLFVNQCMIARKKSEPPPQAGPAGRALTRARQAATIAAWRRSSPTSR